MHPNSMFRPVGIVRSAEEERMDAEEAWLTEALEMIKQQRNALQMERLRLETKRQQLLDLNIDELIAEREKFMNQASGEEEVPEAAHSSTSSMPETALPQVVSNAEGEPYGPKDLTPEIAGGNSNVSNIGQDTSAEPLKTVNMPFDINMSMEVTDKPN